MSKFEQIVVATEQRRRRINSLRALSVVLLISLSLSFLYLVASALALLPGINGFALILFNIVAGVFGSIYGWQRSVDVRASLFQVDRALGLGEKLSTLHELKTEKSDSSFLPIIEERIASVSVDPRAVFGFTRQDKQRWMGVGAGLCACLLVTLLLSDLVLVGPDGVSVLPGRNRPQDTKSDLNFKDPEQNQTASAPKPLSSRETVSAKINELNKKINEVMKNPQLDPDARREELAKLAQEAQDLENTLWGSGSPGRSGANSKEKPNGNNPNSPNSQMLGGTAPNSNQNTPSDERQKPGGRGSSANNQQREQTEQQKQALQDLKEKLENEKLTVKELRDALRQLRDQKQSGDPEVEQALDEAEQAQDTQSAANALERAIEKISQKQATDQQLKNLQNQLARGDGPPSEDEAGEGRESRQSSVQQNNRGVNSNEDSPNRSGSQPSTKSQGNTSGSGIDPTRTKDESETENDLGPKGTMAGQGSGGNPLGNQSSLPELPEATSILDLQNNEQLPNLDIIMSFITQGMPLENAVTPTGQQAPALKINFSKVDTALDLLGVPPEMRDEVLSYFLSLSAEPKKQPTKNK
jgi:hypothetical protein